VKSLPNKLFGPSGIPCVFTIDDDGTTAVGYFTKQISAIKFWATNGTVHRVVTLAQNGGQVSDLTHMPPGICTVLVTPLGGETQHIRHITATRCLTIQGHGFPWHNADPTEHAAGITIPDFGGGDETFFRLLEDGSKWLLETGDDWLTQQAPPYLLMEDGGFLLLNENNRIVLEGSAS
jgi:hypothetical protein